MKIIREACIETKEEFDLAFNHHAEQFELCSDLSVGGLTPTDEMIKYTTSKSNDVLIMIRNRADFFITNNDLEILKAQIIKYKETNIKGFVFGFLTNDGQIDINACKQLLPLCGNKEKVFHMAFDQIENWKSSIDKLVNLGFTRILTKGGIKGPAVNNINTLKQMCEYAKGKIQLIVGGSVNDDNYLGIYNQTNINIFHGRKLCVK